MKQTFWFKRTIALTLGYKSYVFSRETYPEAIPIMLMSKGLELFNWNE